MSASSLQPIDPQLGDLIEQIEKESSARVSVLAAGQFRYSLSQTIVEVTISKSRKFNVLEEFILRAGIELSPPPTENELASVLGLDSVFVQSTTATLRALQTLSKSPNSQITLTPEGQQFYQQGFVSQPPENQQIYVINDPLQGKLSFLSSPLKEAHIDFPNLEDFINLESKSFDVSSLMIQEIQQHIQNSNLGLHRPEEGKIITAYQVIDATQRIWQPISIFVIFDAVEEVVRIQVRQKKQILEAASNWLNTLYNEGQISLQALWELSDEALACKRDTILKRRREEAEMRIAEAQQSASTPSKRTRVSRKKNASN